MSKRLDKAKKVIKDNFSSADCGLFDSRNVVGDRMVNIYCENGLKIDICYSYSYFEVFGLSDKEFTELGEYYSSLRRRIKE